MQKLRVFELTEDLAPYSSAQAVLMRFDGKTYVRTRETACVHEFVGTHGERGDRGYAFLSEESQLWEVASGLYQQIPSGITGL